MEGGEQIIRVIDEQRWLDTLGRKLQPAIAGLYQAGGRTGMRIRDFFHGVWLGHPLHAVITDVVVGGYSTGLLLDSLEMATGKESFGKGADGAIALGAISAAGAATAGLTDWMHTSDTPRKVGMLHAILNTTALSLYIASLAARKGRNRQAGHALGMLGFLATMGAAYLGGHMVYRFRLGVDHAPGPGKFPQKYTPVIALEDLAERKPTRVDVNEVPVVLVRDGKEVFALAETCAHLGGPLSEGTLEGESIVCPLHGSRYDLRTGAILNGPSTHPQPCLQTRVRSGQVEVRASPDDAG